MCAAFSAWCAQLSSSISTAAPVSAIVAGSRCSGRASTKITITTVSTASACLSSRQSMIASTGRMAMIAACASGVAFSARPHSAWIMIVCTTRTITITGVR